MGTVFKATGHAYEIPSWEGRKPKASGWVLTTKNPPRRCGEGFSSLHPLPRGDLSDSQRFTRKIQVVDPN
jgi:hypothetical protein